MHCSDSVFSARNQGRITRFQFISVTILLFLFMVLFPFPHLPPKAHAQHVGATAAYSISGTVFNDFNQNGTQDNTTSITETGINGVVVTAYNAAGTIVTSATTNTVSSAQGQYTLNIPNGTGPVRVQFSNVGPTSSIADLTGLYPSNHIGGTSVQFVSGASATNTVNLGLERPAEYCQNQPTVATSCYVGGNQGTAGQHVIVSFPSSANGTSSNPTPVAPIPLADSTEVGATWGLAYRRSSNSLFVGAYLKRHSGFKPSGSTGAIYLIGSANSASPGNPSLFVDLNVAIGAGTAGSNPHNTANYTADNSAYDQIGKVSLGGMAISDDETTLYVMNLNDKKLYAIALGTPPAGPTLGAISSTAVPTPSDCISSDTRPFAVTAYHGLIYVGVVCSAESTVTISSGSAPLGDRTKMHAYVFVYTPGSGFTTTPKLEFPLNYTRHCIFENITTCNAAGYSNLNVGMPAAWNPWHTGYIAYQPGGGTAALTYPQPMFTSLAFDDGDMIIGLRDRFGDQSGPTDYVDPSRPSTVLQGMSGGDLLRACLNTSGNFTSGWTLESNALCGGIQTTGRDNGRGPGTGVYNATTGNGQYYYQSNWSTAHDYVNMGSALQLAGQTGVVSIVYDPISNTNAGGVRTYNNTTAAITEAFELYNNSTSSSTGTFGKSSGLGSLVAFCQAAPIEIGNRVWADTNGNGIQDAGESNIAGATVHLYASDGTTLLQTTTTNATGNYYFTISPYTNYVVKLDRAADYASGGVLNGLRLTLPNQDTTSSLIDSAATLPTPTNAIGTANYPTIAVASHAPGENDHSFDIGLTPLSNLSISKNSALGYGNLARTATATASSTLTAGGWSLGAVNDGQLTSTGSSMGWTSNLTTSVNHTEWVQLDFGTTYPIHAINLYPRNDAGNVGYGFPIDFTITTSINGVSWTTLVSQTAYPMPTTVQTFAFATQTVRDVRITGTTLRSNPNDANNYRMQFAEITIY